MSKSFAQLQLKLERDRLQRTHKRKPADAQGGQRAKSPRKRARRVAKPGVPLQPTLKRHCPLLSHVLERRSPACDGKIVVFPANVPALTQQTRYVLVFRRMGQASLALHTSTLELEPQPGARYAMAPGTPVVTRGDVLIHAGDIVGNYGKGYDIVSDLRSFVAWLQRVAPSYEHVVFIAGNHDTLLDCACRIDSTRQCVVCSFPICRPMSPTLKMTAAT